jgi:hypothetical protein
MPLAKAFVENNVKMTIAAANWIRIQEDLILVIVQHDKGRMTTCIKSESSVINTLLKRIN